jgi:hypothetical protein
MNASLRNTSTYLLFSVVFALFTAFCKCDSHFSRSCRCAPYRGWNDLLCYCTRVRLWQGLGFLKKEKRFPFERRNINPATWIAENVRVICRRTAPTFLSKGFGERGLLEWLWVVLKTSVSCLRLFSESVIKWWASQLPNVVWIEAWLMWNSTYDFLTVLSRQAFKYAKSQSLP